MKVIPELWGLNVKFLFSNPEKAHPCTDVQRTFKQRRSNTFEHVQTRLIRTFKQRFPVA